MENKDLMLKRAKNAVIARDFAMAVRIYSGLIKEEPNNIQYLNDLGNIYVKAGNDQKAIPFFEKILSVKADDFNALNSIGGASRRLGKYDDAVKFLQKALATGKNDAEANYNLGFTFKAMGRTQEAIDCFEEVIAVNPRDVLAYNHLGSIYASQKDHQKAISTYKRGLQIDPNHPILQFNMAKSCEAVHDEGAAVLAYENALKARPGWQDAVSAYAEMLIAHRKTKAACDAVKNSIALHPQDSNLHNLLGKILILQGNYESAIDSCEKADKINPDNSEYLTTLARSYEKAERAELALQTITKAVALDDGNTDAKKNKIHIQLSAGMVDEAGSTLNREFPEWKEDPELLNLAGQYYIMKDQDSEAEDCQKKSLSLDPSYTDSYNDYATRYKQVNKLEKAKAQIKKAIDENMKDVSAWILQGQIDEALGNFADAEEEYSTAMAFDPNNILAGRLYKKMRAKNKAAQEEADNKHEEISGEEISLDSFIIEDKASDEDDGQPLAFEKEDDQDILNMDKEAGLFTDMQGDLLDAATADAAEDGIGDGSVGSKPKAEEPEEDEEPEEQEEKKDFEMPDFSGLAGGSGASGNDEDDLFGEKAAESADDGSDPFADLDNAGSAGDSSDEDLSSVFGPSVDEEDDSSKGLNALNEEEAAAKEEMPSAAEKTPETAPAKESEKPFNTPVSGDPTEVPAVEEAATEEKDPMQDFFEEQPEIEDVDIGIDMSGDPTEVPPVEETVNADEDSEDAMDFGNPDFAFDDLYESSDVPKEEPKAALREEDASMIAKSVENAKTSALEATTAAEKAWRAAQNAADAAQASGQAESYIREVAQNAVEEAADKAVFSRFEKMLPAFTKAVETPTGVKDFEKEIELFKKLREIGESLPEPQHTEFLESKTRVMLDYLIARLSGRQGLLNSIMALKRNGLLKNVNDQDIQLTDKRQAAVDVLNKAVELSASVKDPTLVTGLRNVGVEMLKKI